MSWVLILGVVFLLIALMCGAFVFFFDGDEFIAAIGAACFMISFFGFFILGGHIITVSYDLQELKPEDYFYKEFLEAHYITTPLETYKVTDYKLIQAAKAGESIELVTPLNSYNTQSNENTFIRAYKNDTN